MTPIETRGAHDGFTQTLAIYMFSLFRVVRNGERVDRQIGSKSARLLKILVANRSRCLPKDQLMEMIWPQNSPSAAATSLKVAAHKLRRVLEPDMRTGSSGEWIIADKGTYRLNPDAEIWIDTDYFRDHYEKGRLLYAAGSDEDARLEFEVAESAYQGDYLEQDVYEDWTVACREELRDLYLDTVGKLATLALRRQAHEDVIRYCHRIVAADPCREDAYRMLMRSHGALNQIARAGSWYAVCRSTLQREIGSSPSAETVTAFEELFADPEPDSRLRSA